MALALEQLAHAPVATSHCARYVYAVHVGAHVWLQNGPQALYELHDRHSPLVALQLEHVGGQLWLQPAPQYPLRQDVHAPAVEQ